MTTPWQKALLETGSVTIDPTSGFLKSVKNPHRYKELRLPNGLRVILISDSSSRSSQTIEQADDDDSVAAGEEDNMESEEQDQEETLPASDAADEMNTDDRAAADEIESAVALAVHVGSLNDPPQVQGMAHLLEHVITMGNEEYPEESGLETFLGNINGSSNASTTHSMTVFELECPRSHLQESLKRLAACFSRPLLRQETIYKEINPVDSEFLESLSKDDDRLEQFWTIMVKKGHPLATFTWGNKKSLIEESKQQGINLRNEVVKFWKQFYYAENMTLTIHSMFPFAELEKMILVFRNIPSKKNPKPSLVIEGDIFDMTKFHRLYFLEPVKEVNRVILTWALPPSEHLYRIKPIDFLSGIIGHEGKGSLLSYLKKKDLAYGLSAGCNDGGSSTLFATRFSIDITLTCNGVANVDKVCSLVFSFLKLLQRSDAKEFERIYKEESSICFTHLRFEDEIPPVNSAKKVARGSFFYEREDLLIGDSILNDFNWKEISSFLHKLLPATVNIILQTKEGKVPSKIFRGNDSQLETNIVYDQTEEYMQLKYCVKDIPENFIMADIGSNMTLPIKNTFIPSNFDLVEGEESEFPDEVSHDDYHCLWFAKNVSFKSPRLFIYFVLKIPVITKSAKSVACIDLFLKCLEFQTDELLYPAVLVGTEYSLFSSKFGLVFRMDTFTEIAPRILSLFLDNLRNIRVTELHFQSIKKKIELTYKNNINNLETTGETIRRWILEEKSFLDLEKIAVLSEITFKDVIKVLNQLFSCAFVEILIQGNAELNDAKTMAKDVVGRLKFHPLAESLRPTPQVRILEVEDVYICIQTPCPAERNSLILNTYQLGKTSIKENVLLDLLIGFMGERAFDHLRTKHNLGYSVASSVNNMFGIANYSIMVISPADQFTCHQVDEKVDDFLQNHFLKFIIEMDESTFSTLVSSLIEEKSGRDIDLREGVNRNWFEIIHGFYVFDRLKREISILRELTLIDFQRWAGAALRSVYFRRKLSIQVVGNGPIAREECISFEPLNGPNGHPLKCFNSQCGLVSGKKYLSDLRSFKDSLRYFPC